MREADVEKYLVKVVKSMGGECRKVKWIGRVGAPDRVVMLPCATAFLAEEIRQVGKGVNQTVWGAAVANTMAQLSRTFWIELKAPGKMPTKTQLREHARMRKLGQQVYVLDSIGAIDTWAANLHTESRRDGRPGAAPRRATGGGAETAQDLIGAIRFVVENNPSHTAGIALRQMFSGHLSDSAVKRCYDAWAASIRSDDPPASS